MQLTPLLHRVMISAMTFKVIAKNLLNLIYPVHCAGCGKALSVEGNASLCDKCLALIKTSPFLGPIARDPRRYFSLARSACIYEGVLKELIHSFKYKGHISLARILSSYMIELAVKDKNMLEGINAVSFVPAYDSLTGSRDYNHSQVLAGIIARRFGLPLLDSLKKVRRTRPQNELSREERLVNLIGAFNVRDKRAVWGEKILLVDDVMTTGATLDECAKTLLENGATEVRCLTLSKGI
jgi:competence protein ComFC